MKSASVTLVVAVLSFLGCTDAQSPSELVDIEIAKFHAYYNDGRYADIFASASYSFRQAVVESDLVKYFADIHSAMGPHTGIGFRNYSVHYKLTGTEVAVQTQSMFEFGVATESFHYVTEGDSFRLQYFRIDVENAEFNLNRPSEPGEHDT